jgi:hypothetical protein
VNGLAGDKLPVHYKPDKPNAVRAANSCNAIKPSKNI